MVTNAILLSQIKGYFWPNDTNRWPSPRIVLFLFIQYVVQNLLVILPAVVEDLHGNFETFSRLSNDVLDWHRGVLEVDLCRVGALDAHLLLGRAMRNTAEGTLNDKRGNLEKIVTFNN